MPSLIKRLIPFLLIGVFLLQLAAIEKGSEPFPAILLPPFQASSPIDSIPASKWEVELVNSDKTVKTTSFQELYPMAPLMTAFYMTLALTKEVNEEKISSRKSQFQDKAAWKRWVLEPRENALENAWRAYPEALMDVRDRARTIAGEEVEMMKIKRKTFLVRGINGKIDTISGELAHIPLNLANPIRE